MDISKASNFERFVFDLIGRDCTKIRELWSAVDRGQGFDFGGTPLFEKIAGYGFVSGSSSHADRLETIRRIHRRYGVVVDTHTADGIKVAEGFREPGVPMVCLETALPAKFEDTIVEALGRQPERPAGYEDIESLPQRFEVMDKDAEAVKRFIAERVR